MYDIDNPEGVPIKAKGHSRNWKKSHLVFLALPALCIGLVPWGGFSYLCGRMGRHLPSAAFLVYPAVGLFMIYCFVTGIGRLASGWRRDIAKKKLLISVGIVIPVVFVTLFALLFSGSFRFQLWRNATPYTYGFGDRVRSRADIPAIRNWLETLGRGDYVPQRDYYSSDKLLPEPLKRLGLGKVSLSKDNDGNPQVRISAGGGFHHWGATIGLENMVIPESDLRFHYDAWLLVEPGVYVYEW